MSPSELRAAAEYFATTDLCTCDPESGVTRCMGCDVAAMARHILSTVRADDGEPVTEEWVASLSPPRYWEAGREYSWPTKSLRYACELVGVSGIGAAGFYIDGRYEPHYLEHIKTRGQLRNLLSAVGIEAKEQA